MFDPRDDSEDRVTSAPYGNGDLGCVSTVLYAMAAALIIVAYFFIDSCLTVAAIFAAGGVGVAAIGFYVMSNFSSK